MFLEVETAAWPCHFAGLAVLDGPALPGASGRLRLDQIAEELQRHHPAAVMGLLARLALPAGRHASLRFMPGGGTGR